MSSATTGTTQPTRTVPPPLPPPVVPAAIPADAVADAVADAAALESVDFSVSDFSSLRYDDGLSSSISLIGRDNHHPLGSNNVVVVDDPLVDDPLAEIAAAFQAGVEVKDRTYRFKTYRQCFVGSAAVDYLLTHGGCTTRVEAVALGQSLMDDLHLFEHVTRDHPFADAPLFYRFVSASERGNVKRNDATGHQFAWSDFLSAGSNDPRSNSTSSTKNRQPQFPRPDLAALSDKDAHVARQVWPLDEYNTILLNNVHPAEWQDPTPNQGPDTSHYDLVVIGGGTAGLITAAGAAGVGAKVALIEAHLLGGDCLNVGCVPSKTLLHAAHLAHTVRSNGNYLTTAGIYLNQPTAVTVDFGKVMERVRAVRAQISHHDSALRYSQELGVEIYIGHAVFASETSVLVNGRTLTYKRAAICTGAYPTLVPMTGLQELYEQATLMAVVPPPQPPIVVPQQVVEENPPSSSNSNTQPMVMTNETFFNMTVAPRHLVVLGAGVIGMELAQAMQRLGIPTTVLGRSGMVLPKEDADLAQIVQQQMIEDGVTFRLDVAEYQKIELTGTYYDNGYPELKVTLLEKGQDKPVEILCDAFLVAAGRRPNVSGLNLEVAKVQYDVTSGLVVNDRLQTTNPRIYGVGDCCSEYKFTHAADFMARAVIRNALFFGKDKMSNLLIPYATYTSPEIASVGLYGADLRARGREFRVFEKHFKDNDRALADDATIGLVRIRVDAKTDEILGASIVGAQAGNLISEVTLAMQSGTGLSALANVIHPYPTTAEAIRQTGDLYNRTKLTNTARKVLRGIVQLQR